MFIIVTNINENEWEGGISIAKLKRYFWHSLDIV